MHYVITAVQIILLHLYISLYIHLNSWLLQLQYNKKCKGAEKNKGFFIIIIPVPLIRNGAG